MGMFVYYYNILVFWYYYINAQYFLHFNILLSIWWYYYINVQYFVFRNVVLLHSVQRIFVLLFV